MLGWSLRPGRGVAADDWRVATTWRTLHGKLAFASASSRTESMILWRRVAAGLTAGQQQQLFAPLRTHLTGDRCRMQPHEIPEAWRLVGSLERLPVADKIAVGDRAAEWLDDAKRPVSIEVLTWALARLGGRVPLYGSLSGVVGSDRVEPWIDAMLPHVASEGVPLALVQCSRLTGDRFRDVSLECRQRVLSALEFDHDLTRLVRKGGSLASEQQSTLAGDRLPLGITMRG